jgi:hypothetical protein
MSTLHANPGAWRFLLRFSAVVTWGISPMVLGEKAHCLRGISAVCSPSARDEIAEVYFQQALTGATGICRALTVKGEGRAKA